jgi:tRNA(Ile)-lysidine synthase
VLLHLLRGSGLRGLAGMTPAARWPIGGRGPRLVRPLLGLTRVETELCCRDAGVTPLRDPSNRSPAHLRNRIRRELLPLLRRYNPRVDDALARLAGAAADDDALLEELAARSIALSASDAGVRIDRRALAALPASLQRHAVRLAVERLRGDARGLSDRHVRAVLAAAAGPTGARLDLARGLHVEVRRDALVLATRRQTATARLPARAVALAAPGAAHYGPWRIEADVLARPPRALARSNGLLTFLDADACAGPLRLRRRRPGDRFQPLGLPRQKKLQDFFVDAHVPRAERDAVPLLCAGRGIAWVVGQRPAEWAKVTPATRRVLRLRASRTRR